MLELLLNTAPETSGGSNLPMWIAIGAGVVVVLYFIMSYNKFVRLREGVKNAWSQIDVQLQRRYELIPNLVEIAKGYMKHEKELLERVTAARSGAMQALKDSQGGPSDMLMSAEASLGSAMRQFSIQVEAYPELKANSNMMQLTEEVTTTENKISFARQYYNDSVTSFNTSVQSFPGNIIAGMFSFKQATLYEVDDRDAVKNAPKINF